MSMSISLPVSILISRTALKMAIAVNLFIFSHIDSFNYFDHLKSVTHDNLAIMSLFCIELIEHGTRFGSSQNRVVKTTYYKTGWRVLTRVKKKR